MKDSNDIVFGSGIDRHPGISLACEHGKSLIRWRSDVHRSHLWSRHHNLSNYSLVELEHLLNQFVLGLLNGSDLTAPSTLR